MSPIETTIPERQRAKIENYAKLNEHDIAGLAEDLEVGIGQPVLPAQLGKVAYAARRVDALVVAGFDRCPVGTRLQPLRLCWISTARCWSAVTWRSTFLSRPGRCVAHIRVETQQWTVNVAVVKRCCLSVPVVNTITRYWFLEDDMEMVSPFGPLAVWGWPLSSNHWYCATRLSAVWATLTDSVAVLPINPQL